MKKVLYLFLISFGLYGCRTEAVDIRQLNGYWEIEKVVTASGETKVFTGNETLDFFSLTDSLHGFRVKVMPNILGTFSHNNTTESLKVYAEDGQWKIRYHTPFAEWEESLLKLTENTLELQSAENTLYIYKRYLPDSIIP